jgi:hypothetical protein
MKKAIISGPKPVSQILILSKSLKRLFGTNSRLGLDFGISLSKTKSCHLFETLFRWREIVRPAKCIRNTDNF